MQYVRTCQMYAWNKKGGRVSPEQQLICTNCRCHSLVSLVAMLLLAWTCSSRTREVLVFKLLAHGLWTGCGWLVSMLTSLVISATKYINLVIPKLKADFWMFSTKNDLLLHLRVNLQRFGGFPFIFEQVLVTGIQYWYQQLIFQYLTLSWKMYITLGLYWQYRHRYDRKQDEREGEWHAAKGTWDSNPGPL